MSWVNPRDEQQLYADVAARMKKFQEVNSNDAVIAGRIAAIYRQYPYMATGVVLSLAEANADQATIDAAASKSAYMQYLKAAETPPPPEVNPYPIKESKFSWGNLVKQVSRPVKWALGQTLGRSDKLKTASRYALALAEFPKEYTANYFSYRTDTRTTEEGKPVQESRWHLPEGMIASTSIGALLQHPDQQGSGFTLDEELEATRLEKVKKFRWQINKESYTVGRGTAQVAFTPGSLPYRFFSGLIDAGIAWKSDPFNKPVEKVAGAAKARNVIAPLQSADEIAAARKLALGHAGILSTAEQHAIDTSKFFNWLDNSSMGRRVVERTAAETDKLKILRAFNGKISAEEAVRLANTTDVNEIRGIIAEQAIRLSDETTQGFVPFATSGSQLAYSKLIPAYKLRQSSRWLSKVPKNQLIVHGTEQEKVQAIFNIENWLKLLKVDPTTGDGKAIIDKAFEWASSSGTRVDADQMFRLFMGDVPRKQKGIMWKALEANGVSDEVISGVIEKFRSGLDTLRKNAINEHGMTDDAGFIKHMTQFMTDDELETILREIHPNKVFSGMTRADMDNIVYSLGPGELTLYGPMAISDMLNHVQILPDARMMRRLTTNKMFQLRPDGEQLAIGKITEMIQNELWRPYALMSIGYIMRNTMDAQLRLGLNGFFSDPIQYALIFMRKRGIGTIKGSAWVEVGEDIPFGLDDLDEYKAFVKSKTHHMVDDPAEQLMNMVKNNEATIVNTGDPAYISGFIDTARKNYADPFMRLYTQIMHLPEDRQIAIVTKWLDSGTEDAVKARNTIVAYLKDGPLVGSTRNGINRVSAPIQNADSLTTDELVEAWFDKAARPQVDQLTLGRDELRVLAGYNSVPVSAAETWDDAEVMRFSTTGKLPKAGEILVEPVTTVSGKTFYRNYLVMEISGTAGSGPRSYKVIEVRDVGNALKGATGSKAARKHLEETLKLNNELTPADTPILPTWVLNMIRTKPALPYDLPEGIVKGMKAFTKLPRWFFDVPVQKWNELAERSPAFRFAYYKNVAESAALLSPDEAVKLMDELNSNAARILPTEYAANAEKAVEKYVGGRKFYKQIKASVAKAQAGSGQGTVEELHVYSATATKADLEDLFFNNMEKSNFTDAMRIVAPFAAAWAEVAGRYATELIQNPARIRKTQLVYRGIEDFDPDNDGRGWIYKDPQSGEQMFTFPLSGQIIKAVTGQEGISLTAPVKRLSAGLAIIPSVGPVFQIAASKVFNLANIPDTDSFRKLINPYGNPKMENLLPGSFVKFVQGLTNRPDQLNAVYGNTYADLFAYLSTTGEYDLNDSEDVNRMHEDAKTKARGLTVLRAVSQFVGPTAARPEYRYKNELGEYFWVNEMVKQYSEWQNENYDTAIGKFMDVFGEDALIYLGSKTSLDPRYKGVEASEAYGKWESKNQELIRQFKSTAPYLAPIGDRGLAMGVWSRQLGVGVRRYNEPVDRLEQAQYRAGSYLYFHFQKKNPDATAAQKRAERERIHENFNGFPVKATFAAGEYEKWLDKMTELVNDKRTANDPVAGTIREYLKNRQRTLDALQDKAGVGFQSDKAIAQEYKSKLFKRGEELATLNPDFRRVWEQEFSAELE
jgi:hypothetical protein